MPSSAIIVPSPVLTSGLTSTRVASSDAYTCHSSCSTRAISLASSPVNPAASTISSALAWSMPTVGSTGIRASASGRSTASVSMSIPPSREHMAR